MAFLFVSAMLKNPIGYLCIGRHPFLLGQQSIDRRRSEKLLIPFYGSSHLSSLITRLGVRAAYTWTLSNGTALTPEIQLSWEHSFLPDRGILTANWSFSRPPQRGLIRPYGTQTRSTVF